MITFESYVTVETGCFAHALMTCGSKEICTYQKCALNRKYVNEWLKCGRQIMHKDLA